VSSEHARCVLAKLAPEVEPRLRIVPNAVGPWRPLRSREAVRSELGLAPERLVVGCVARLVPPKGLFDLVAAAAWVGAAEPRAAFVVVGDGPLRSRVEAVAQRCGARIDFVGERDDVADLLGAFDVFALASHWEGSPIAVLEAMSAGLPVVATAVGGVPGIVSDGETGVLVPPGAPDALAAQVLGLLRDPERARRLGEAGKARALARHRVETLCDGVQRIYREVLERA
jgi:glycosyltransferase involved in cell wall biosynthesis